MPERISQRIAIMNAVPQLLLHIPRALFAALLRERERHLRGIANMTAGPGVHHKLDEIALLHRHGSLRRVLAAFAVIKRARGQLTGACAIDQFHAPRHAVATHAV